jgi:NitT/TauT family transport system ATP-binding protein
VTGKVQPCVIPAEAGIERLCVVNDAGSPPARGRQDDSYVELDGVTKTYRRGHGPAARETHALDAVDLSIREGEFLAIVGPSGCGKSTLLRIIAGLHLASTGEARVGGRRVDRPQTDLGIVFQSPVLLDWRTVLDNVLVQVELRGMKPRAYRDRALRLLAQVGLADFIDRYPHELSGGMRQRVAIARALIHDAPLLLMDEPFGALDALTREQMRLDLEALWLSTRKTVVFITHSIDEAVLLADRVVVMSPRPGRIERVFDIRMPRPRGLEARRHPAFIDVTERITGIFLARGVLHGAAAPAAPGHGPSQQSQGDAP